MGETHQKAADPSLVSPAETIDFAVIEELAEYLPMEVLAPRLQTFRSEMALLPVRLWQELELGEIGAMGELAHKFSGAAGIFGAVHLRECLLQLERACKTGDASQLDLLCGNAARAVISAEQALDAHLAAHPAFRNF